MVITGISAPPTVGATPLALVSAEQQNIPEVFVTDALVEAVLRAGVVRAKPIVLTGLAAMLGALFIVGDPIFSGLAISLILGIPASTLLTLVVIQLCRVFRWGVLIRPFASVSPRALFRISNVPRRMVILPMLAMKVVGIRSLRGRTGCYLVGK